MVIPTLIKLQQKNRDGESIKSSASNKVISSGLPDAPSGLAVASRNQQLTLSWNLLNIAPASNPNDEGSAITSNKIYKDGVLLTSVSYSTIDSVSIENGVSHSYQISAVNANGEGPKCKAVSQSASSSPDAPNGLSASHNVGGASIVELFN